MKTIAFIIPIILVWGCSVSKTKVKNESVTNPDLTSDYIFDQEILHTIELELPEENLATLDADPAAEKYVEASLIFEGKRIAPVGLRYKGSIGSFVGCVSGKDWINPSGYKTCTKLSMKVKVDWEDSDQTFYGLKKIQLHSMNHDKSQMRDRLGYRLFAEMGVPSPRSTHARVVINGQYVGLFALIEQIDDLFTSRQFGDKNGALYKEVWPIDQDGNPTSDSKLIEHLESKKDFETGVALFSRFGSEISESVEENVELIISKWMNIPETMSYAVVDRVIRADDGPFHWYCFEGNCAPHNFYWYADSDTKKVHLLPWDMDNAFENMTEDRNPVTPVADAWGEITSDCEPFPYGKFNILQRSAACDKLTAGWVKYQEEYDTRMEALMKGPFAQDKVYDLLDKWSVQIRSATQEASREHDDAVTEEKWEAAMESLKTDVRIAHERYQQQLSAK